MLNMQAKHDCVYPLISECLFFTWFFINTTKYFFKAVTIHDYLILYLKHFISN